MSLAGVEPNQLRQTLEKHTVCTSHTPAEPGPYTKKHTAQSQPGFRNWDHWDRIETPLTAAMVKCLIRITTRVNVHLRMINHCYRDVKVRVLSLGPRMLGKALGVLPLYPALTGLQESASSSPVPGIPLPCVQPSDPPGKTHTDQTGRPHLSGCCLVAGRWGMLL